MPPTVREFRRADAGPAAEALHAAVPYRVTTPEIIAWQVAHAPPAQRYRMYVAELDGLVVGTAGVHLAIREPARAFVSLSVHPAHRGQGAGTGLLAAAQEYAGELGATTLNGGALEESVAFAERRGFERGVATRFQRLDLTSAPLPELDRLPDGVELHAAAHYADDPRRLYETDVEITADVPGNTRADSVTYDDWLALYWDRPDLDRELSSVVVVDGEVAVYVVARTDRRSRYWSGMTGTRRGFRGRGLAKLAKNHSLHRARAAGYTEAFTVNHASNAPMLAVNRWFGYQPSATEWKCVRDLTC